MTLAVTGSETHSSTSVPTADCLCSLDTSALAPGELAYVQNTRQFYFFDPEATTVADGYEVVCAPNDCGRWIRACINCSGASGMTGMTGPGPGSGSADSTLFLELLADSELLAANTIQQTLLSASFILPSASNLEIHFDASGVMQPDSPNIHSETTFQLQVNGANKKGTAYSFEESPAPETFTNSAAMTYYMSNVPAGVANIDVLWRNVGGASLIRAATQSETDHASLLIKFHPA